MLGLNLASAFTRMGTGHFNGFMMTLDAVPPAFLPFIFSPEEWEDDWEAEYTPIGNPASRHKYPIYTGNSERTISFSTKFDSMYPVNTSGVSDWTRMWVKTFGLDLDKTGLISGGFTQEFIENYMSVIEYMKLPKKDLLQKFSNAIGGITSISQGNEPCPPLVFLALSIQNFYIGYLSEAKIQRIAFDRYMRTTRFTLDCKLLYAPSSVFTTIEDSMRMVNILKGFSS